MPRLAALFAVLALLGTAPAPDAGAAPAKIPVIFDTDIGDDIDDTWALVMLLRDPHLDVKLVTTTCGKAEYRAKLIARILEIAKRTDIPIGLGAGGRGGTGRQQEWVKDYDLAKYPGKVHDDGVKALIDLLVASPKPVPLIAVGPLHTPAAALERRPDIAGRAVFVGMHGSVRIGYGGSRKIHAEYNVKCDVPASKRALGAPWTRALITPLDTCGLVKLRGDRFKALRDSDDPVLKALMENYRIWAKKGSVADLKESSILFDTVAIYLAEPGPKPLVKMEDLKIAVDDKGYTRIDPAGAPMAVATAWTDYEGYLDRLVRMLQGP